MTAIHVGLHTDLELKAFIVMEILWLKSLNFCIRMKMADLVL